MIRMMREDAAERMIGEAVEKVVPGLLEGKQDKLTPEQLSKIANALTDANQFDKAGDAAKVKEDLLIEIGKLGSLEIESVAVLPTTGKSGVIYLVPSPKPGDKNLKDEYLWIDGKWELIGSTAVDLSGYVKNDANYGIVCQNAANGAEHAEKRGSGDVTWSNPHGITGEDVRLRNGDTLSVTDAIGQAFKDIEDKQDKLSDAKLANIDAIDGKLDKSGGTMTGPIDMNGNSIVLGKANGHDVILVFGYDGTGNTARLEYFDYLGNRNATVISMGVGGKRNILSFTSDVADATRLTPVKNAADEIIGYTLGGKATPELITSDALNAGVFATPAFKAAVEAVFENGDEIEFGGAE